MLPHQHARPVQLPFRRPGGDLEHHRNLAVLVTLDVVQHEDFSRAGRQPGDGALEVDLEIRASRSHREPVERLRAVRHPLALDRERSPPLDHHVDREAMEPGRERRLAAELTQFLPGPHEDVLRDLVGLLRAEHPAGQAVDPADVGPVEPLEGRPVASGRQGHVAVEPASNRNFAAQRHHRRHRHHLPTYNQLDGLRLQEGCQGGSSDGVRADG